MLVADEMVCEFVELAQDHSSPNPSFAEIPSFLQHHHSLTVRWSAREAWLL
jgi:hypothetical protein